MGEKRDSLPDIDLSKPRYDQSTYRGRARHFLGTTSVLNIFASKKKLEMAKEAVENYELYRSGKGSADAAFRAMTEDLWRAKTLKESAYHPDTGKLVPFYGRMSFQLPGNTLITGCMMVFHTNPWHVGTLQFLNQLYNAISFYHNRSGPDPISKETIFRSFALATGTATSIAWGMNYAIQRRNLEAHIIGKFVAYAAVVAANCVNIPIIRQKELREGIPVVNEEGVEIGRSKKAASKAIMETVFTRILIATTVMVFPEIIMRVLENRRTTEAIANRNFLKVLWKLLEKGGIPMGVDKRGKFVSGTIKILLVGTSFIFAVPFSCATYPQMGSISLQKLEPGIQENLMKMSPSTKSLYYNRGL